MLGTYQDKLPNEAMIATANNLIQCGLELVILEIFLSDLQFMS